MVVSIDAAHVPDFRLLLLLLLLVWIVSRVVKWLAAVRVGGQRSLSVVGSGFVKERLPRVVFRSFCLAIPGAVILSVP